MSEKQERQRWKREGYEIERVDIDLFYLKCGGK
jgi:hypothetical protein